MNTEISITFAMLLYKVSSLVAGLAAIWMGYRLFMAGIWGQAGDIEGRFKETNVVVKQAAPGTVFALVGMVIVCFVVFKGMNITEAGLTPPSARVAAALPDELPH